jgi:alkaline phosphatase
MNRELIRSVIKVIAALLLIAPGGLTQAGKPRVVKNIIVMIGDGMGFNQVWATDMFDKGTTGSQLFEKFPIHYAMSTYPTGGDYDPAQAWSNFYYVIGGVTDSAAAATAMSTGRKTYDGGIGMIGADQAGAVRGRHAVEYAEAQGMATGVVSTNFFSDATPAGFVAHNVFRDNTYEIAQEMLGGSDVDVIMGAGHPDYDDNGQYRPGGTYNYVGGQANWNALVNGTLSVKDADHNGLADDRWTMVESKEQFENLATTATPPKRVCGVARVCHSLQWFRYDARGTDPANYREDPPYAVALNTGVPTLVTMARGALNVLSQDPDGFFVMIEGGSIDWACHNNQKGRLIEEVLDFDHAVEAVAAWVETHSNWQETLLIVTADHENGHLWGENSNPAFDPLENYGVGHLPGMKYNATYHTNTLVPFFAKGPAAVEGMVRERANQADPVRGLYLDNAELGQMLNGVIYGFLVPVELSGFRAE